MYKISFIKKEDVIMTQMYQPNPPQPGKGLAVAALVLGIISVVFFWIPFVDILTLVLGIVAVILAIIAGKQGKNGMAVAGLVLGIIGVVFSAISFVSCVLCSGLCEAGCYACQAANALSYYY